MYDKRLFGFKIMVNAMVIMERGKYIISQVNQKRERFAPIETRPSLIFDSFCPTPSSNRHKGKCGKEYGSCDNNECCSKYGYCGKSSEYCGKGCQSEFGRCDNNKSDKRECGPGIGKCSNGECCSKYGYCGKGTEQITVARIVLKTMLNVIRSFIKIIINNK
ncbi:carbohydrate-binding module family 18 protein [Piromyces sp. E2]|nr:carbohydrate-binding module family 18 protein [Piromyces sp. E2]|eukprot:OUM59969.1 carbohydrate-binding module family 18 protein [Piromyces sp. E2]